MNLSTNRFSTIAGTFALYRRQAGRFDLFDRQTGKRESLQTSAETSARRLLHAKNEAQQQPPINRQIARAYLAVGDPEITRRTWRDVMAKIIKLKHDTTQQRWITASKDRAFDLIHELPVFETQATHFLRALERGRVATLLQRLPQAGPLFPHLRSVRAGDHATEFKQRCRDLGIEGVSLHSYRYAWAERAKVAGYPERFAQEALGHNSKAVHRAYAREAQVVLPSLEEYGHRPTNGKIVKLRSAQTKTTAAWVRGCVESRMNFEQTRRGI